jgi:hypothetical protein
MFTRSIIIIKRGFCHHRDLIPKRVSILSDKEKIEDLTSKINRIEAKIDQINKENIIINNYIIVNFVLTNAIFMPLLFFKI